VIFTCRKILRHVADGFTFPLKQGVLRIFIALKKPSLSAGFEPANLGSNGSSTVACEILRNKREEKPRNG
jgi:hypothetical protein